MSAPARAGPADAGPGDRAAGPTAARSRTSAPSKERGSPRRVAHAAARARGLRRPQVPAVCPRAALTAVPRPPSDLELVALLARARAHRGVGPFDRRQFVDVRAVVVALRRAANGDGTGTVRRSMPQLVAMLAGPMGWSRSGDRFGDRDRHHASVRRWLRDIETAGLLSRTVALDDEGQDVAIELTLRPLPNDLGADELELATAALAYWRRRYGPDGDTGAARSLPAIARRGAPLTVGERQRRGVVRARRSGSLTDRRPPFGASPSAPNTLQPEHIARAPSVDEHQGAREKPLVTRRPSTTNATQSSEETETSASEQRSRLPAGSGHDDDRWQDALLARVREAEANPDRPPNHFELHDQARDRRHDQLLSWSLGRALPPTWMLEELWHRELTLHQAPRWSRRALERAVTRYEAHRLARPDGFPESGVAAFALLADGQAPDWLLRLGIGGKVTPQGVVVALERLGRRMGRTRRVAEAQRRDRSPRRRARAQRQLAADQALETQLRFTFRTPTPPNDDWQPARGELARQHEQLQALAAGRGVRWGAYDAIDPNDELLAAYRRRTANDPDQGDGS